MKQTVGQFHDVVFGKAGNFFAVMTTGIFKCVANNFFRAGPRYQFQTLHHLIRLAIFDARVEVLFILADNDHIHVGMFCLDEWVIRNTGAHVRIQAQRLAYGHIQALVATALRGGDRRLEKDLGVAQ